MCVSVCVCTGVVEKNESIKQSISLMSSCKKVIFNRWFLSAV